MCSKKVVPGADGCKRYPPAGHAAVAELVDAQR